MSVTFYTRTIGPQIDILKLKRLCYNFCPTSVIRLLDYLLSLHTRILFGLFTTFPTCWLLLPPLGYCEFSLTTQASVMRAVTNLTENTDLTTSVMGMAFHWTITTIFNICQSPTLLSFPFSAKRVFAVPWVLSPFVWVAMSWVVCEAVAFTQLYPHLKGWSIQYRSKVSWHSILHPCMNRFCIVMVSFKVFSSPYCAFSNTLH